jgi:hypothetical protein
MYEELWCFGGKLCNQLCMLVVHVERSLLLYQGCKTKHEARTIFLCMNSHKMIHGIQIVCTKIAMHT